MRTDSAAQPAGDMRCPVEVCELRQGVATSAFRAQGRRFQILQGVGKLLEYQLQNPSVLGNDVYNNLFLQIFGMHGINLPSLLDTLRQEGEVVTIGTETGVLESKRCNTIANTASTDKHVLSVHAGNYMQNNQQLLQDPQRQECQFNPSGRSAFAGISCVYIYHSACSQLQASQDLKCTSSMELHHTTAMVLQVCKIQESDADYRKFYVNSGTNSIRLRAETEYVPVAYLPL